MAWWTRQAVVVCAVVCAVFGPRESRCGVVQKHEHGPLCPARTLVVEESEKAARRGALGLGELDGVGRQKASDVCVDYTIEGYYYQRTHHNGAPPSGYVRRPSTLTPCELEQLHNDCANQVNRYRSGELRFSDGTQDSNVRQGLSPLQHRRGTDMCASEAALGDLIANYAGGGGCAGAHDNAFVCDSRGSRGQNSCCSSGDGSWGSWDTTQYDTYDKVKERMFACLQSMWDEGITAGQKGHWENMRSTTFSHIACGFGFSEAGRVTITQDFYTSGDSCSPSCSKCGESDGCSGNECYCSGSGGGGGGGGSSGGEVAGAVIGTLAGVAVLGGAGYFVHKRRTSGRAVVHARAAGGGGGGGSAFAFSGVRGPPKSGGKGNVSGLRAKFGG